MTSILSTTTPLLLRPSKRAVIGRIIHPYHHQFFQSNTSSRGARRNMSSFSFAGPRKLSDVMKTELLEGKSKSEVSDIWMTYHEEKEDMLGMVISGKEGETILKRASQCPFFIQPIFRDDGYFVLLSQFQSPSHFLLAYLEDYKMDPNRAQPLLTFSVFDDLSQVLDVSLIRCDVINKGINGGEGWKVAANTLDSYRREEEYEKVKEFNLTPDKFDFDDYISCQNRKWRDGGGE
eukprot:CAMPEP_0172509736 /NCGR_PEP_ID=MMETSP1066-20121228/222595_1 /TAXON_ID=671091 /ORGANISM="Coscinodiscus wailesii, Strain CCMP2513" /LENGTH=233 /DNA_ID=CAMNT_0013288359 /DNA_START=173 /DNA_END=874 /DNA_ORIENTATION=+